ncbi:T9SS type A sorting domain-containing protein [Chryseobacterium ginsengisoli]
MKKILFLSFIFSSVLFFSQITMSPFPSHFNNPYQVTISGNGTIYYTTDGSTPTLSSSSAVNSVQIYINQRKEIKAFIVNGGTTSSIVSKKYYTSTIPTGEIYFKPPSTWVSSCVMVDMVNPNSINGYAMDTFWPGPTMTSTGCNGWYKITANFEDANVRFNNCSPFENIPGSLSTNLIPVNSIVYYDYSDGAISNPPSCLFLGTNETKNNPVTLVKIYPNPVSDILKINSDIDFKGYEILDMSGKIINENKTFSKEISIHHLPSGNYFIKLKDSKNNFTLLKFIKK